MKRIERQWMYQRLDDRKKIRIKFVKGVADFVDFTMTQRDFKDNGVIRCPCRSCKNLNYKDTHTVKAHLYNKGFCDDYFEWSSHGEAMSDVEPSYVVNASNQYETMVRDAFPPSFGHHSEDGVTFVPEEPNPETKKFFEMLKNAKEPLYAGCKRTLLEMASRVIKMKCDYNLAHRCVDDIASLVDDYMREDSLMTRTFHDTKKLLRGLELPVHKIHACPNGCMLFWKHDAMLENCTVCGGKRYSTSSSGKRVATKILTYFPITPRLQRLYATAQTAEQMRWHKDNPRVSGTMAHPSDGEAWKHFDRVYPEFASEPRNVRLGLCTDGFAPYGKFGGTYSCWPVIATPYNLCNTPNFGR